MVEGEALQKLYSSVRIRSPPQRKSDYTMWSGFFRLNEKMNKPLFTPTQKSGSPPQGKSDYKIIVGLFSFKGLRLF